MEIQTRRIRDHFFVWTLAVFVAALVFYGKKYALISEPLAWYTPLALIAVTAGLILISGLIAFVPTIVTWQIAEKMEAWGKPQRVVLSIVIFAAALVCVLFFF